MPASYHTPGRAYPRERARESYQPHQVRRRRPGEAPRAAGAAPPAAPHIALRGAGRSPHVITAQLVETRRRWADEWAEQTFLHATSVRWTASPEMPTAALIWDYGLISRGREAAQHVEKLALDGHYVRITFTLRSHPDDEVGTLIWHGVLQAVDDDQAGEFRSEGATIAVGQQAYAAYGLERLLDQHRIITGVVYDYPNRQLVSVGRGLVFNRDGRPNREDDAEGKPQFTNHPRDAQHWTFKQIGQHLLANHTPRSAAGIASPTFVLEDPTGILANHGRPEIATDGRTTLEVLAELLPREQLQSFTVAVNDDGDVAVRPFTFAPESIDLAPLPLPIPGNTDKASLDFTRDPTATARTQSHNTQTADQTVVRSARRTTTATLYVADATLAKHWNTDRETEYRTGYPTTGADYPGDDEIEQRGRLDAEVRGRDTLEDVYTLFGLPLNWHRQAGRGDGEAESLVTALPVENAGGEILEEPAPYFDPDATLERQTRLLDQVDYSGNKIDSRTVDESETTGELRAPFVVWRLPESGDDAPRYVLAEHNADQELQSTDRVANHKWSGTYQATDGRAFRFIVQGQPRHVIAQPFLGNDVDDFLELGDNDYRRHMAATVTIRDDRHAEGRYPADADIDPALERVTRDVLTLGDLYRLDYVAPQTVVDIDDQGHLVRSYGGYLRDDRPLLTAIAKLSHTWRQSGRRTLELSTHLMTAEFRVGRMITRIGEPDSDSGHAERLDTVITEVVIETPVGSPDSTEPPRQTIRTQSAELDVLRIAQAARPQ